MGFFSTIFGGGDLIGAVERIASEAIETDMESAEAKALWIKTLDPNGLMRRRISDFASRAYGFYLAAVTVLIIMHFFGLGDPEASQQAVAALTELFTPITTAWATIVGASFGVNGMNSYKGK